MLAVFWQLVALDLPPPLPPPSPPLPHAPLNLPPLLQLPPAPQPPQRPPIYSFVPGFLAYGPSRHAMYRFPCIGPCQSVCETGTLAQPFRGGPLGDQWQRMCRACYGPMLARARWRVVHRCYASYVARVLACGLLRAHARACERLYVPAGVGWVHARDEFEGACRESERRAQRQRLGASA